MVGIHGRIGSIAVGQRLQPSAAVGFKRLQYRIQ